MSHFSGPDANACRLIRPIRLMLTLAFLLALLVQDRAVEGAEPHELRVLCYNIHYGQGTDGEYDIERLAAVITNAKPDLVALQEVDVGVKRSGRIHEARRLAELTGMSVRFGPTQHYEGGLFGNAVLTKFPISDVAIHPLPYTESTPERTTYPRGAIVVTVIGPDKAPLRFISTHFQHNVAEDRLAEAKAINRLFVNDKDSVPTILAGDMNATPDSAPMAALMTKWVHAIDKEAAPTAPSKNPRSRIDYVVYRPNSRLKFVESKVIPEELASDHRPVLAIFKLIPK